MLFFSIVIPVYNVAEYLNQCVDSVLSQTYKDFEIILVNDSSTDNSLAICEKYLAQQNNVRLINLSENSGSSVARNIGVKIATGKYVIFLDSDDYWDSVSALQNIANKLIHKQSDFLLFHSKNLLCTTNKIQKPLRLYSEVIHSPTDKYNFIKSLIDSGIFPGAAWLTVTKRSLLDESKIYFIEGKRAEDIDWLFEVISKSSTFDFVDDVCHVYRKYRNGSVTMTPNLQHLKDLLWIIDKWRFKTQEDNIFSGADVYILRYLAYQLGISILMFSRLNAHDKAAIKPEIVKLVKLFKYGDIKYKVSFMLIKVLGLKYFSKLVNIFYFLKKD